MPASAFEPQSPSDAAIQTHPDLSEAVQRIRRAERIFVAAGIGVEQASAQAELEVLAEAWGAPVTVTPKAKGHFPEDHRLYAGTYGVYGDEPLRAALGEADLILAVGLDGIDFIKSWTIPAPVISLAQALADDPAFRPALSYDGDLRGMLRELTSARKGDDSKWAAAVRDRISTRITPANPSTHGTVAPQIVFRTLRQALPADGVITVDVGSHKLLILQMWVTTRPKTFFVSNGLSAMGYALPAAMALKLARPEVPVAAVTGDGGLLMYAGELETLARLGAPVVLVALVDASLALIHMKQTAMDHAAGYGVDFGGVDYRALAGAFGLTYRCIDRLKPAAVVISGARTDWSVYPHGNFDALIELIQRWDGPMIGLCGDHQAIAHAFGAPTGPIRSLYPGEPDPRPDYGPALFKELGPTEIRLVRRVPLFDGLSDRVHMIQDHYWAVKELPACLELLATNETCPIQAFRHRERPIYGTQFHPERYDSEYPQGRRLLQNFFRLVGSQQNEE